jgi:hypothetical protein
MAEVLTFEQHLTSVTGGRGSYHMEYSHYHNVPVYEQTKIVAAYRAEHRTVTATRRKSRDQGPGTRDRGARGGGIAARESRFRGRSTLR